MAAPIHIRVDGARMETTCGLPPQK